MDEYRVFNNDFRYVGVVFAKTPEEAIAKAKVRFGLLNPILENKTFKLKPPREFD
jgi:hypothetical protein